MADVDLIVRRPFTYGTRRLKAGDSISLPSRLVPIYTKLPKGDPYAEAPRPKAKLAPPPAKVVERAADTTPQRTPAGRAEGSPRATTRKRRTRKTAAKK